MRHPAIATGVGGVPEVLSEPGLGWLTPPGDADAFLAAMNEAASLDPERRREMGLRGAAARRRAVQRFAPVCGAGEDHRRRMRRPCAIRTRRAKPRSASCIPANSAPLWAVFSRRKVFRVIAPVAGRGPRTQRLCREAGLEIVGSLADAAELADVMLSVVPPSAAVAVAEEYLAAARRRNCAALYVDVNSVSPDTVARIGGLFAGSPVELVDAAVHGVASRLRTQGALYLSGRPAPRVAAMFGKAVRVRVVGEAPGQASALKSVLAGMSKGLAALFFEAGVLAREAGLLRQFLEECSAFYPGVMEAVDRTAPSYPRHAARRRDEMRELEHTMETLGLAPHMVRVPPAK